LLIHDCWELEECVGALINLGLECRCVGEFFCVIVCSVDGDWRGEYGMGIDRAMNGI
jgi:hypothetical protein